MPNAGVSELRWVPARHLLPGLRRDVLEALGLTVLFLLEDVRERVGIGDGLLVDVPTSGDEPPSDVDEAVV